MTMRMLIDARHREETRVAVVKGNRIEEFDFESAEHKQLKGNIYLAKVTRVEPSLQAAFIEFGGNRHGFLAFSEIHPDYYQIPKEDREALLREEAEHHAEEEARRAREEAEEEAAEERDGGEASDEDARDADGGSLAQDADVEIDAIESPEADDDASEEEEDGGRAEADTADAAPASKPGGNGDADTVEALRKRRMNLRRHYKIQDVIRRRQVLLVQVVKEERGNKGAALTTYLSLAGRYCVLMPNTAHGGGISRKISSPADRKRLKSIMSDLQLPPTMGCIVRTAGLQRTKIEIRRDFDYLARLWDEIRENTLRSSAPALIHEDSGLVKRAIRDIYNRDIDEVIVEGENGYRSAREFMKLLMPAHAKKVRAYADVVPLFQRAGVEDQLNAMYQPVVQLKSGGYIVINPTEALVSIDINSGRSTREHNIEQTATATNLEAAYEIARQLRLRDMAGLVVIDFIDMENGSNVRKVEKALKDALRDDRARIQVGRISSFGLLEMSRQRLRTGVLEASTRQCPHCDGTGLVRTASSAGLSALRLLEEEAARGRGSLLCLRASQEAAIYVLNRKRAELAEIEDRYGVRIEVVPEGALEGVRMSVEAGGPPPAHAPKLPAIPFVEAEDDDDEPIAEDEDYGGEESEADAAAPRQRAEGDEGDGERRRKRRRRRRGGRRDEVGGNAEATSSGEAGADPDADEEAGEEIATPMEPAQGEEPRRGRRGRRGGRRRSGGAPQNGSSSTDQAEDAPEPAEAELALDEPEAEAEADTEVEPAPAVAEAAEERPRTRRRPRARGEQPSVATGAADDAEAEPAEPAAPARTRSRRKSADPAVEGEAPPAPRRSRARAAASEATAELALVAAPIEASEPASDAPTSEATPEPAVAATEDAGQEGEGRVAAPGLVAAHVRQLSAPARARRHPSAPARAWRQSSAPAPFWRRRARTALALLLSLVLAFRPALADPGVLRDTETERYFADISAPLIKAAGLDPANVKVVLLNDPEINAFVAGGQMVFIQSGLVEAASNTSELQGVIAHELGHIEGGHVPLAGDHARPAMAIMLLSLLAGAAAMAAGAGQAGMAAMMAGQTAAEGKYLAFSRSQEGAADASAVRHLNDAHLSGKGMVSFFSKLKREEYRLSSSYTAVDPYAQSHPMTDDRQAALQADLEKSPWWNAKTDPALDARFDRIKAKLGGYLDDPDLTLRRFPETNGSVPAHYARAYAWHRAAYPDKAAQEVAALLAVAPHDPYFLELKGQILLEGGKPAEAVAPLREAVARSDGAPLIGSLLGQALLATEDPKNFDEAKRVLKLSLARDDENPDAWYGLGIIYDRQGDQPRAALATAERYAMQGNDRLALGNAEQAMKNLPIGTPDYIRAEDIAMSSRAAVEQKKR